MRKYITILLALVLVGLGLGLFAPTATATAPNKLVCTGTVVGGTYHSVTVPEGESCTLIGVDVIHNVKALHAAHDVKVLDSVVGGNVHVKGATGLVHVGQADCKFDPPVRVNVLVYDSHHVLICYVDAHNIQVKRNDGRITLRDNTTHRIDVSQNLACVKCADGRTRPGPIRLIRNTSETHIHAFGNDRKVIERGNTPTPIVR